LDRSNKSGNTLDQIIDKGGRITDDANKNYAKIFGQ
jgi:hypothetical protein